MANKPAYSDRIAQDIVDQILEDERLMHLIKAPADIYTECGIAISRLCGTFTPEPNDQHATKQFDKTTCPRCIARYNLKIRGELI